MLTTQYCTMKGMMRQSRRRFLSSMKRDEQDMMLPNALMHMAMRT